MKYHSNDKDFMKEVEEMFAEDKPKEVDWKSLSENLNKALAKEIDENRQLNIIISYLEEKLGLDTV
jgi:hypothetical protein